MIKNMENIFIHYSVLLFVLFAGMLIYFKIADKYNIIDKPNQRSSHNYITIRGGGIIFWLAGVLYTLTHLPEKNFLFLIGLTAISLVSFWDDISSLPNKIRIVVHFLSISLVFCGLGLFPLWLVVVSYIFFVGVLNAYNFMDGINGITGLYSLVILLSMYYVNIHFVPFAENDFIVYAALACVVFLFFNYRKKAKCFAGDVGSMAISFWIVTLLLMLMLQTQSLVWILFLSVYGVDAVCTILHRLYLKQNIFEAHRLHFYQILSNECEISHLKVSVVYGIVQLFICMLVIYNYTRNILGLVSLFMIVLIPLIICYLWKFRLMKKY